MPIIAVDTEVAWAAGLFDGEGSVFGSKTKLRPGHIRLNLVLAMTEESVVRRFAEVVGNGKVTEIRRKTAGGKTVYRYQTQTTDTVRAVLTRLWPYLSGPKRQQAQKALDDRMHYESVVKPQNLKRVADASSKRMTKRWQQ